jgi:hypothetical protein
MITVKICDETHLKQAVAMTQLKDKIGGAERPYQADYELVLKKYVSSNSHYVMLGAFDGEELLAFICIAFWRNEDPSWFIVFMFTKVFTSTFSFKRPEIGLLIKTAFEIAEHRHYWKYYYSIAKKHETIYDRLWQKNSFVGTGRYDLKIETEVPAETPIERERFWRLIGSRVYEVDVVIKSRILKPEMRVRHDDLHPVELEAVHKIYDINYPQLDFNESESLLQVTDLFRVVEYNDIDQEDFFKFCQAALLDTEQPACVNMWDDNWYSATHTLPYLLEVEKRFAENGKFFVLLDDNKIIACSGIYQSDFNQNVAICGIRSWVNKEYRGQFLLGSHLFPAQVKWAKANGYKQIAITFNDYNSKLMNIFIKNGAGVKKDRKEDSLFYTGVNQVPFPVTIKYTPQWVLYQKLDPDWEFDYSTIRVDSQT